MKGDYELLSRWHQLIYSLESDVAHCKEGMNSREVSLARTSLQEARLWIAEALRLLEEKYDPSD